MRTSVFTWPSLYTNYSSVNNLQQSDKKFKLKDRGFTFGVFLDGFSKDFIFL